MDNINIKIMIQQRRLIIIAILCYTTVSSG